VLVLVLAACFCHSSSVEEIKTAYYSSYLTNIALFFFSLFSLAFVALCDDHMLHLLFSDFFFLPFISFSVFVSPFNQGLLLV